MNIALQHETLPILLWIRYASDACRVFIFRFRVNRIDCCTNLEFQLAVPPLFRYICFLSRKSLPTCPTDWYVGHWVASLVKKQSPLPSFENSNWALSELACWTMALHHAGSTNHISDESDNEFSGLCDVTWLGRSFSPCGSLIQLGYFEGDRLIESIGGALAVFLVILEQCYRV